MNKQLESRLYGCFKCRNVVACQDDIFDKNYVAGNNRRAFLFSHTKNTLEGEANDRNLITGIHNVCDIYCSDCGEAIGWRYLKVYQEAHLHKLGKTVLMKCKIDKIFNPPFHY